MKKVSKLLLGLALMLCTVLVLSGVKASTADELRFIMSCTGYAKVSEIDGECLCF